MFTISSFIIKSDIIIVVQVLNQKRGNVEDQIIRETKIVRHINIHTKEYKYYMNMK